MTQLPPPPPPRVNPHVVFFFHVAFADVRRARQIKVLNTRRDRRRHRRRTMKWSERHPSGGFVLFWTMALLVPGLYILAPG